jgi:hypothetical protein
MSDATKELRRSAAYQVNRSAVETFAEMLNVYKGLEPALRDSADRMVEIMGEADTTESEWNLSMHTLMELLLGD